MSTPKLYVATPAYGCLVNTSYLASLLNLQIACARRGISVVFDIIGNESLVQRARCILAERFAKATDATHLLFIDADIGFGADAVMNMLDADKDVISCVYPKKNVNWSSIRRKVAEGSKEPLRQMGLDFNINLRAPTSRVVSDGLLNVLDTATGFLLIKRRVIEAMKERYRESLSAVNDIHGIHNVDNYVAIFDCMIDPDSRRYLSEDYAFCRRWQQMDPANEIWIDVRTPLSHTGSSFFSADIRRSALAYRE